VLLGVSLNGAAASTVRGNRVSGKHLDLSRRGDGIRVFSSDGAIVEANDIEAVRDVVVWYSSGVRLTGNTVRDSRYGMHFMYANKGIVEENHLVDNSVGVFLMYSRDVALRGNRLEHNRGPSGYGIGLKDMDGVAAERNTVVGNRVGLYVDNSPSRIDVVQQFRRNVFAFNDVGLAFLPSVQRNQFIENEFLENIEQVAILGSGELKNNDFTVAGRGNFWSDYAGFDTDGDGRGDMPYQAMSLFESLIDREPKLRLFLYSPAQQAVELASRAFPIVRPQPKITDTGPLMRPVPAISNVAQAGTAWPLSALGAGLLTLAALLAGALRRRATVRNAPAAPARQSRARECGNPAAAARPLDRCTPPQPSDSACSANAILTITNLRKKFRRQVAVDDLNLAIAPGQAVALWGTNGAGKTTIIKCILGLHGFHGGIRIGGRDARREGKAARRLIGYVSQELSFYDDLSALETARLFAELKRVRRARAREVLAQVELLEHSGKRVAQLSGGMKQRLALAVALLADPPILLLDEPTSNLDAAARRAFFDLLRGLKAAGKTILFTTHRAEEVAGLADRVIVLERGRVLHDGAPADFGADCHLRISLPVNLRDAAHESLLRAGFDVTKNCTALLVRVPTARNATPIAHLAGAGIDVPSFELESGDNT
jgi:nitrous oxidase accessory protein